jgi:hypothetical protein
MICKWLRLPRFEECFLSVNLRFNTKAVSFERSAAKGTNSLVLRATDQTTVSASEELLACGSSRIWREQPGGPRHGSDIRNLHRYKRAVTLNLKDPEY